MFTLKNGFGQSRTVHINIRRD